MCAYIYLCISLFIESFSKGYNSTYNNAFINWNFIYLDVWWERRYHFFPPDG